MSGKNARVGLDDERRSQFKILFDEFLEAYVATEEGQRHMEMYEQGRRRGRENFEHVVAAAERGESITDLVLLKLVPHSDTESNREKGAWIHVAPSIGGDIRRWFEGAGWTDPDDWPRVAEAILDFVRRCYNHPAELEAACKEFDELPYTTGFQTGMLTPILNALRPGEFLLINNKSRDTINHFAHTSHGQKLRDYPATNVTGWALIDELTPLMQQFDLPDLREPDLLDMFSHWLVAVKDFELAPVDYWKIAPGRDTWQWDDCREEGFIAIGWDELGDLSRMTREEFDETCKRLAAQHDDWTERGMMQAWTFAQIREGDRIVANDGISEVLGIGRVTGPYYYVEGERHGHRYPVKWEDTTRRKLEEDEHGWRRTLVKLDREKFEAICNVPAVDVTQGLAEPFSKIFVDREEAEWAFGLLNETLQRLGVTDPTDERFCVTLRHNGEFLRLNFGNWAILHFSSSSYYGYRVGMVLFEDQADIDGITERWSRFDRGDDEPLVSIYRMPIELARPLDGQLREAYENTLAYVAEKFQHWQASPYRKHNVREIARAVFDPEERSRILTHGITSDGGPTALGYFTPRTFELLEGLHRDPTRTYYMGHHDAFETHLMQPFKRLFHDVADSLPPAITDVMETERWLFSRIPKNDFGQGGAWDYYWGAFYPRGSKRTTDAQLSLWIDHERLEFGFYIGDQATEQRQRFLRRCRENYDGLARRLKDVLSRDDVVFGQPEDTVIKPDGSVESELGLTWQEWLEHPDQAGFDVSVVVPRDDVLVLSQDELRDRIARTFERLFPLVLLVTEEEPIPAIDEYLKSVEFVEPPVKASANPTYSIEECAVHTHFDRETLEHWVRAIERKKQAILYGPPGTGKTYLAEHLARHLIGGGDGFTEVVQFHPAYAYEDFIQGLRPEPAAHGGLHFELTPGRFLDFCRRAEASDGCCVLIIDEINRANLSRVFGELMYLLEYRDREVPLAGGGTFQIPENVRIIGTMNTADRSIALVDHALRRRFAFLALYPDERLYDVLRQYHRRRGTGFDVVPLIQVLKRLNRQIDNRHYAVGITFFLLPDLTEHVGDIWRMEIEPYLEEYFFDQPDKVDAFRWSKVSDDILP